MENRDSTESNFSFDPPEGGAGGGSGSKLGLIGIGLGVIGIALGLTGLLMANGAKREITSLREEIAARPDKSASHEALIKDLDDRLVRIGSEFVKLNRQDKQIRDDTQLAFDGVTREIAENRQQINEATEKMKELLALLESGRRPAVAAAATPAAGGSGGAAARPAGSGGSGGSSGPDTPALPAEGVYLIQSGDTLSNIASRFGVSLNDLLQANPGINPRALQIGQKINLPVKP